MTGDTGTEFRLVLLAAPPGCLRAGRLLRLHPCQPPSAPRPAGAGRPQPPCFAAPAERLRAARLCACAATGPRSQHGRHALAGGGARVVAAALVRGTLAVVAAAARLGHRWRRAAGHVDKRALAGPTCRGGRRRSAVGHRRGGQREGERAAGEGREVRGMRVRNQRLYACTADKDAGTGGGAGGAAAPSTFLVEGPRPPNFSCIQRVSNQNFEISI